MPCTLSHPAAVLTLQRFCPHCLAFPALVIGSMTPDFGYYIHRFGMASFAHTIPGSFAVCLPSGAFLLLIFYLLRKPVCFILPMPHGEALLQLCSTVPRLGLRSFAIIPFSLLLGAWSHILWDSFTHQTDWFVAHPVTFCTCFWFSWLPFPCSSSWHLFAFLRRCRFHHMGVSHPTALP